MSIDARFQFLLLLATNTLGLLYLRRRMQCWYLVALWLWLMRSESLEMLNFFFTYIQLYLHCKCWKRRMVMIEIIFVLIVFVYTTTTYFACYYYCRIYRVRYEQHRMPDSRELYQQRLDDLEEQRRRATEHKAIVVSRISSNPRVSSTNCTTETSFSSGNNSVEILMKEWKSFQMRLVYEAIIFPRIETSSTSLTTTRLWSSLIFYSANEAH